MELGDGTFQQVMKAPHQPLVVIVSVPSEGSERTQLIQQVETIGQKWRQRADSEKGLPERAIVFTWMDGERWATWLKSMYGISDHGAVVIADHGGS